MERDHKSLERRHMGVHVLVDNMLNCLLTAYWIAFGPHGPRALDPPGENWRVFGYTMLGIGISFIIFWAIRSMARPAPGTMNAQYQEMTNEYLKARNFPALTTSGKLPSAFILMY